MPDHFWKCVACGKKSPPYTEVCRNCQHPAKTELAEPNGSEIEIEPKAETAIPRSDRMVEEIYPFQQIKDRGLGTKLFAFIIWSVQFIAFLVALISFKWKHIVIAAAVIFSIEVINRKVLHIRKKGAKSAT